MKRRAVVGVILSMAGAIVCADTAVRMVVVKGQDVHGHVFKRLGLPNREYCWSQCMQEERCTAVRWGVIAGDTAGQCALIDGEVTLSKLPDLKTSDGKKIVVTASRKETGSPPAVNKS